MRIYTDGRELPAENEMEYIHRRISRKMADGTLTFKTISMISDKNTVLTRGGTLSEQAEITLKFLKPMMVYYEPN